MHKNPDRLEEVNKEVAAFGCKIVAQYAVLGAIPADVRWRAVGGSIPACGTRAIADYFIQGWQVYRWSAQKIRRGAHERPGKMAPHRALFKPGYFLTLRDIEAESFFR